MSNLADLLARRRSPRELFTALLSYRRQWQDALTNWTIVLVGLLVLQGVAAVTTVLVANRVDKLEYGQYLASVNLASLLIILPNFGMDTLLLARGGLSHQALMQLWQRLLRLRLGLLSLWLVAMALLTLVLPADTYPFWVLLPTAVALALESLVLLSHSALRSVGRHGWVTLLQMAATAALLAITFGLQLRPGQIALFGLSRAAIWVIVAPLMILATWRLLRQPTAVVTPAAASAAPRSAMAFMVSEFTAAIYSRAPVTVVALYLGNLQAANFGTATQLIQFTFVIPNALYFVVLPLLARLYRERLRAYRRVGWAQLGLQGLAGGIISLGTLLFGTLILTKLFGANYAESAFSLLLLSPLPLLKSLNFGLAAVLTANGRQTHRAITQVICAVFNGLGSILFVHMLGLFGVIIIFNLSEALLLLGYALGAVWPARPEPLAAAPPLRPAGG